MRTRGVFALIRLGVFAATCTAALAWTSAAAAVDTDISPRLVPSLGRIATYGYADSTGGLSSNIMRVFPYFFGNYDDPYYDQNPGIHALGSNSPSYIQSGLPPGSYLGFDVLSDLRYWNGTGTLTDFNPVPSGETLQLYLPPTPQAPYTLTIGSGASYYPGFPVGVAVSSQFPGYMHQHIWAELHGSNGNNPADGIYLFEMRLTLLQSDQQTPYPGVAPTLPLFILYDNNVGLSTYQTAQAWVKTNLAPFGDFDRNHVAAADSSDLTAMLQALTDVEGYKAQHGLSQFDLLAFADINEDGVFNNADIQAMLNYLSTGQTALSSPLPEGSPVPEPTALILFVTGIGILLKLSDWSRANSQSFQKIVLGDDP